MQKLTQAPGLFASDLASVYPGVVTLPGGRG